MILLFSKQPCKDLHKSCENLHTQVCKKNTIQLLVQLKQNVRHVVTLRNNTF